MARSVSGGRSVYSNSKGHRKRRSKTTQRHNTSKPAELTLPDVAELRSLRTAYYRPSTSQRHRSQAISTKTSASKTVKARAEVVSASSPNAVKPRAKDRARRSTSGTKSSKSRDRIEEYVYGAPAFEVIQEEEELDNVADLMIGRRSSQSAAQLHAISNVDLAPSDSVSQVAERRRRSRRKMPSTPRHHENDKAESISSKRSSIFGSIFSRLTQDTVATVELVECLTCGAEDLPSDKTAKLECGHRMCNACLRRIFKLSVQDPAHMPPKCCTDKHIPLKHVAKLFDLRFKLLFNKRFDEYNTKNRVYCCNRRCGAWIRPANYHKSAGRRYAQCPKCRTRVCLLCGMKLHKSSECPKDPEIAKLMEQASEQGWKRCYSCQSIVELREGCNHMTCRCTAEFCMVCGAKWKTCDCPWFSTAPAFDFDRLDDMNIPEPVIVIRRHVVGARARTYGEELRQRQQQEVDDEDLARRLQHFDL